jgi:hypothetical protein
MSTTKTKPTADVQTAQLANEAKLAAMRCAWDAARKAACQAQMAMNRASEEALFAARAYETAAEAARQATNEVR